MAGGRKTPAPNRLSGIALQSSVNGSAIPIGWGTFKVSANLLWYGAFKSIPQTQKNHGGKGGGASSTTSYNYTASVVMGLCAGPISGVRRVYKGSSVFVDTGGGATALSQANVSLATGALGQAVWSYLTTNFAAQAIGYSGLAYVYASDYDLGSSGQISNHSFEIVSTTRVSGLDDANPSDIITSFLQSVPFWSSGLIGDLTNYSNYCLAAGLLLSPVVDSQRQAADLLKEILQATNSGLLTGDGLVKIVPYGDTTITGNGATYTPNLTPIYDLTEGDFIPRSPDADPVETDLSKQADAYNLIQLEWLDRANRYNVAIAIASDQGAIDQYGRRQNPSPMSFHAICDPGVAARAAQLIVQRSANMRAIYKFKLGANFGGLEPMDLVTLTSGDMNRVLVRLTKCDEVVGSEGIPDEIDCEAEQMLVGTAHAAEYTRQVSGGFGPNIDIPPGSITDLAIICPPRQLTHGDYEFWVGGAGASATWGGAEVWTSLDGTAYARAGIINAPARIGTTGSLGAVADPDTTSTLAVNLSTSSGQLLPATTAQADTFVPLFLLDSELIAYRDATLTSSYNYNLGYLRRGLYGSAVAAHSAGAKFVRMDDTLARIPYSAGQVGQTIHVKLLSFNQFGRALESLATATDHTITLTPGAPLLVDVVSTDTQNVGGRPSATVLSEIDALTASIATAAAQLAAANAALAAALLQVQGILGVTETMGQALIRQSLASLDLRNLANGWTSLDGERIVKPVANGKKAISLMGAMNADQSAFIANVSTFYISATQSFASYQTQVQANTDSTLALVNSNYTAQTTATTALASTVTTLAATVSGNTASITTLSASQATDHSTFSAQITTLNSNYGSLSATVTSNYSTLSTSDAAQSAAIIGTSATLGGSTTLAQLTSTSLATATGQLYGSIGLAVNVNGAVTSMTLYGSGGGSNLGSVVFEATTFLIKSAAHTSITPFLYDAPSGTLYLQNITVQTANIASANITTLLIAGNAVTGNTSSVVTTGTSQSATEVIDLTVSYTSSGGDIEISVYGEIGTSTGSAAGTVIKCYVDGTLVGQGAKYCPGSWGNEGVSFPIKVSGLSAGSHSITVGYTQTSGSGASAIKKTAITVLELKR
jgi:hypothetical protein